jgi:ATP-dependent RNA helicase DDX54/DBP10
MKLFIHRAGRTARAGQKGTSFCVLTQEELAYMHDLSIFVGRQHYDTASSEDELQELLDNPAKMCFGKLPQNLVDEYSATVRNLHETYSTILDPLKNSIQLSLKKYNKNKDPASANAISLMRGVVPKIHPLL